MGYGLDYAEQYRMSYIRVLKPEVYGAEAGT